MNFLREFSLQVNIMRTSPSGRPPTEASIHSKLKNLLVLVVLLEATSGPHPQRGVGEQHRQPHRPARQPFV